MLKDYKKYLLVSHFDNNDLILYQYKFKFL